MTSIEFDVPAEVAFDFLADPANRPLWQSSLRRVEDVTPAAPAVGQSWVDVTSPGLRPRMETTVLDRPHTWTERGSWRGVTAELTLTFEPVTAGCVVTAEARVDGFLVGPVLTRLAPYAVAGDLRRAAGILLARGPGQ
jgi:hypothetical protein